MDGPRNALLLQARNMALSMPEVIETSLYDGFCRHWTPAYYLGEFQLFHVHNFRAGLRATVFLEPKSAGPKGAGNKSGSARLVPMILDSNTIPEDLRLQAAKAAESRVVKQVKVNLDSMDDVAVLMELARLKSMSLKSCP